MDDTQLLRYNRHILLPQIGTDGQEKLLNSKVLIIGIGGLGSPAAMYLACAGIGKLTLCDFDKVELTNLQRQILHRKKNIGESKVDSAKNNLLDLNDEINIHVINKKISEKDLIDFLDDYDVILDATDNYESRFIINKVCFKNKVPLVTGSAIRFDGQLTVFDFRDTSSPCYRCLYVDDVVEEPDTCSENGVLAPVVGVIGSMQAIETIKLICGIGEPLTNAVLVFDALSMQWRKIKLNKDPDCPVCKPQQVSC